MILGNNTDWHLMLDLETLGTRPTSKIIQVGAILFLPTGKRFTFSTVVTYSSLPDELEELFTTDKETLEWWGEQDSELVHNLFKSPGEQVEDVLVSLNNYVETICGSQAKPYIWCKGNGFDTSILTHHYVMLQGKLPSWWNFRKLRDLRTISEAAQSLGYIPSPRITPLHDALADAEYQTKELLQIDNFFMELKHNADAN